MALHYPWHVYILQTKLFGELKSKTIPFCSKELMEGGNSIPGFLLEDPTYPLMPNLRKEYFNGEVTHPGLVFCNITLQITHGYQMFI